MDYYRGLMALRKLLPALCDKSPQAPARLRETIRPARKCVRFTLDNRGPGSRWQTLVLCYNADTAAHDLPLPEGSWQVLADGQASNRWQAPLPVIRAATAAVPARSALILGRV